MSLFIEKYLSTALVPIGSIIWWVAVENGLRWPSVFWLCIGAAFFVTLIQVPWRFVLVLELNEMGYTVKKSGKEWWVSAPGHGIGPCSLTYASKSASNFLKEQKIRSEERARVELEMRHAPLESASPGGWVDCG